MKELPKGWVETRLGEIVLDPKKDIVDGPFGSNLKSTEYVDAGVPVFKIQNIKANRFVDKKIDYVTKEKAETISRHSFQTGDLIITKIGDPLGLCCKVPEKYTYGIIVADLMRLRPLNIVVNSNFLVNLINSRVVQHQFQRITKGTTRSRVNLTIVRDIQIPLPPLPEQHRIVAKIEELFSSLDKGIESLKTAQAQLKTYRQAVLKWAFEGKLTNENVKEGELPKGWKWVKISDAGKVQLGRQRSPKNVSNNYPTKYIRAANITKDGLDISDVLEMEFNPKEFVNYQLHYGDIVLSEASGSPTQIGKPAIWKNQIADCCFQNTVIRPRPNKIAVSEFLYFLFRSFYENGNFAEIAGGVGINHLSAGKFSNMEIPLPPTLPEQHRIVSEIETRLSVCDKLEESITQSLVKAEALRQSILKKALEGKLVSQNPDDEPASALLERIRSERAPVSPKKTATGAKNAQVGTNRKGKRKRT